MQKNSQEVLYDPRDLINKHIAANGIKQSWVADKLEISASHFSLVLNKERELADKHRVRLNSIWGTDF